MPTFTVSKMPRRNAARFSRIVGYLALVVANFAAHASDCEVTTLREVLTKGVNTVGAGLVLYGMAAESKRIEFVGAAATLGAEFVEFYKGAGDYFNGIRPDDKLSSCRGDSESAAKFGMGFNSIQYLQPLPPSTAGSKLGLGSLDSRSLRLFDDQIGTIPAPKILAPLHASLPSQLPSYQRVPALDLTRAVPATVEGKVIDGLSRRPLEGANVRLVDSTFGTQLLTSTGSDGAFALDHMPAGRYVLSVSQAGYSTYSLEVKVPGTVVVSLSRRPTYPCAFTVFNRTGWTIQVWPAGGQSVMIAPYMSMTAQLDRADLFSARVDFEDDAPLVWGPMPVQCGENPFVEIVGS